MKTVRMRGTAMPEPGRRSFRLGQFRLARLQVVNWGTFPGHRDLPVDERGVLFTGPSGSGKSQLLDAHSVALLPFRDQRFNASADLSARGSKQAARTIVDYVRGRWSENDDEHGQAQARYLRGGRPTWSAVAATYDDGLGAVVTGMVVRWFSGTETDASKLQAMHLVHDGHFDLRALEAWAQDGFSGARLQQSFPPPATAYPKSETDYTAILVRRLGLGPSAKAALSLLGKAKALKNVGDLNLFIRENMLDVPATFEAAKTMTEVFTPLDEAFRTAERAYQQQQVLSPVPAAWAAYRAARGEAATLESLENGAAEAWLRNIHIELLEAELKAIDAARPGLGERLADLRKRHREARDEYRSLDDQVRREGAELDQMEDALQRATAQQTARLNAYGMYSALAERAGLAPPQDHDAFLVARTALPGLLESLAARRDDLKPNRRETTLAAGQAAALHRDKAAELARLRATGALVPPGPLARRAAIAQANGIDPAALPYAAELIDVAPGEERWRPAAEKVLRGFGLRLLVPQDLRDKVAAYIDSRDMRGVVDYSIVTGVSAHRPRPAPGTLVAKLTVTPGHAASQWLLAQVATQFGHACVENAAALQGHTLAVTVSGTVKQRGNHYRKDDRPELTNPSSWILGGSAAAKIEALEAETARLEAEAQAAAAAEVSLEEQWHDVTSALDAATQLQGYASWADLDHWASARTAASLAERIAEARASDVNLQTLSDKRDEAEAAWTSLGVACRDAEQRITDTDARVAALADDLDREQRGSRQVADDAHDYLSAACSSLLMAETADEMPRLRRDLAAELASRKKAASQDQQAAVTALRSAMGQYLAQWHDSAPDDTGDVERSGGDFAALHEEISRRRLPEAMTRFQRMITEDMVPSVGVLHRTIETEAAAIRTRMGTVNAGLRRVEFNEGTHLQIAWTARQFDSAKEFRQAVDDLHRHAGAAQGSPEAALAQFARIRALMARFTGEDADSARWRDTVLDVRLSYTFYGREERPDGTTLHTYRNTAAGSGGEQEKLVAFCLAAALSYSLGDAATGGEPRFAPLMLDEAFSKSDETFASQALAAFDEFGFQLIMAAPIRMAGVLEPFIGQAVLVEKRVTADGARSAAASATFGQLAARREAEGGDAAP
jgi:uncharacterized protein YPO0396